MEMISVSLRGGSMKLVRIPEKSNDDIYQLYCSAGSWEGPLHKIWQFMHWKLEVPNSEVRFALLEMDKKDHNVAHFGIFGTFLFTSPKK